MPAPSAEPRRRQPLRALLLLYALLVLVASLYPTVPGWASAHDRTAHFFAYLLLGALLALSLGVAARDASGRALPGVWWRCGAALLLGTCYGAGIEVAQRFTGRAPQLEDAIANLLGVAAGAGGATLISRLRRGAA